MTLLAPAPNFAAEFTRVYMAGPILYWIWLLLDCGIVYTYFRFGKAEFAKKGNPRLFVPYSMLVFAISFAILIVFNKIKGPAFAEFSINMTMSAFFIGMLHNRQSKRGQSPVIAVSKMIGTLAPTILHGFIDKNPSIITLGLICFVLDLIYTAELLLPEHFIFPPKQER